jgi:hypothetical protein
LSEQSAVPGHYDKEETRTGIEKRPAVSSKVSSIYKTSVEFEMQDYFNVPYVCISLMLLSDLRVCFLSKGICKTPDLVMDVKRGWFKWLGYVIGMNQTGGWANTSFENRPQDRRQIGRPRLRWLGGIERSSMVGRFMCLDHMESYASGNMTS